MNTSNIIPTLIISIIINLTLTLEKNGQEVTREYSVNDLFNLANLNSEVENMEVTLDKSDEEVSTL